MFNDPLTHAQCEKLVDNLRQTAFPFQCAHGRLAYSSRSDFTLTQFRPSLAPLIDLGKDNARRQKICRWSSLGGP